MYRIIGADGKQYGPVSEEVLRRWAAEGRVTGQTLTQLDGTTEWKPLSTYPAFADLAVLVTDSGIIPPIKPVSVLAPKPQTSSMALAGFICGLLSLTCCCLFLSIPGLIFSVIGLVETQTQPHKRSGAGWAIAGIILSVVGLILTVLIMFAFFSGLEVGRVDRSNRWHI